LLYSLIAPAAFPEPFHPDLPRRFAWLGGASYPDRTAALAAARRADPDGTWLLVTLPDPRTADAAVAAGPNLSYFGATLEFFPPAAGRPDISQGTLFALRYHGSTTLLADGRVLLTGGKGTPITPEVGDAAERSFLQGALAYAELYDPQTRRWSLTGSMCERRIGHSATRLRDGRVLVAGGQAYGWGWPSASAELYDPQTGIWRPTAPLNVARSSHEALLLHDGRVLVLRGVRPPTEQPFPEVPTQFDLIDERMEWTAEAEIFDPRTETWTRAGKVPNLAAGRPARGAATCLLADGRVLVVSHRDERTADGGSWVWQVDLFDPETNGWSTAASYRLGRYRFRPNQGPGRGLWVTAPLTFALRDGRACALAARRLRSEGEGGAPSSEPTTLVAHYNPGQDAWTRVATNGHGLPPTFHTAVRLADGRVLFCGADVAHAPIGDGGYIFDPVSGRWATTGRTTWPRTAGTLTLLADGTVLAAAGHTVPHRPLGDQVRCELYHPTVGVWSPLKPEPGARAENTDV
jgi:hypothetical protein